MGLEGPFPLTLPLRWVAWGRLWNQRRFSPQGPRESKRDWIALEKSLLFSAVEKGNLRLDP